MAGLALGAPGMFPVEAQVPSVVAIEEILSDPGRWVGQMIRTEGVTTDPGWPVPERAEDPHFYLLVGSYGHSLLTLAGFEAPPYSERREVVGVPMMDAVGQIVLHEIRTRHLQVAPVPAFRLEPAGSGERDRSAFGADALAFGGIMIGGGLLGLLSAWLVIVQLRVGL